MSAGIYPWRESPLRVPLIRQTFERDTAGEIPAGPGRREGVRAAEAPATDARRRLGVQIFRMATIGFLAATTRLGAIDVPRWRRRADKLCKSLIQRRFGG